METIDIEVLLQKLEQRKEWAESGKMIYNDNEILVETYQSRVEEIQNCIDLINNML